MRISNVNRFLWNCGQCQIYSRLFIVLDNKDFYTESWSLIDSCSWHHRQKCFGCFTTNGHCIAIAECGNCPLPYRRAISVNAAAFGIRFSVINLRLPRSGIYYILVARFPSIKHLLILYSSSSRLLFARMLGYLPWNRWNFEAHPLIDWMSKCILNHWLCRHILIIDEGRSPRHKKSSSLTLIIIISKIATPKFRLIAYRTVHPSVRHIRLIETITFPFCITYIQICSNCVCMNFSNAK